MKAYRFDGPENELAIVVARSKKAAAQIVRANLPEYDVEEFVPEKYLSQLAVGRGETPFVFTGPNGEILVMVAESLEQTVQTVKWHMSDYASMCEDWFTNQIRQVNVRQEQFKMLSFSFAVC